jgi:hypothetical protein
MAMGGGGILAEGDLKLVSSSVIGNDSLYYSGGGIAVLGSAVVRGSNIEDNFSGSGGGGIFAAGSLTVAHSSIGGNRASTHNSYTNSASGGGIAALGDLTLLGSQVNENRAGGGGGIAVSGKTFIRGTSIEGNEARSFFGTQGGGVFSAGDLYVSRSRIASNGAFDERDEARGGGISVRGDAILHRTQVVGNEAYAHGAGPYDSASATGGGISSIGKVTAELSNISDNRADGTILAYGGGIFADKVVLDGTLVLGNVAGGRETKYAHGGGISADIVVFDGSTISENRAVARSSVEGGGLFARRVVGLDSTVAWNDVRDLNPDGGRPSGGGGLAIERGGQLVAVTISGNQVKGSGFGGALVADDRLSLSSSLVIGNSAADGDDEIAGAPLLLWPSIIGGDGRLVFADTARVAPGIFGGVLADNGGPTPTIMLNGDAANPATSAGDPGLAGTPDQRGVSRDPDPDLGAIEAVSIERSAGASSGAAGGATSGGARFVVTTSRDVANGNLAKDDLSLREAIELANAHTGTDRIAFADGIGKIKLRDALPTITDDLRLVGGSDVVLDANVDDSGGESRRALDIGGRGHDISVKIDGMTITGGYLGYAASRGGGGIRSGSTVNLTVIDCTIEGNSGVKGGGIAAEGELTLIRSNVRGNYGGHGGGIWAAGDLFVRGSQVDNNDSGGGGGIAVYGDAAIRGSHIAGNYADGHGAGISVAGDLVLIGSTIVDNRADTSGSDSNPWVGGGVLVGGDLTVLRSEVSENSAGSGGGIHVAGKGVIRGSAIEGNIANDSDGGGGILAGGDLGIYRSRVAANISLFGDGGGVLVHGHATLSRTEISGNIAYGYYGAPSGGGIRGLKSVTATLSSVHDNTAPESGATGGGIAASRVVLVQSTIAGNVAGERGGRDAAGGGVFARRAEISESSVLDNTVVGNRDLQGGGIFANRVDAFSSTIAGNRANDRDPSQDGQVGGGGLWVEHRGALEAVTLSGNRVVGSGAGGAVAAPDGALHLSSSLVVGNTAADGNDEIWGTPILLWPSIVGGDGRPIFAETARLAPGVFDGKFGENGGPTPTIALLNDPTNPAVGTGDPGLAQTHDQRGAIRDAEPDLGAIELWPAMAFSRSSPAAADYAEDGLAGIVTNPSKDLRTADPRPLASYGQYAGARANEVFHEQGQYFGSGWDAIF